MEAMDFNETHFSDKSYSNSSTDLSYWKNLSAQVLQQENLCSSIYSLEIQNVSLLLHQWEELKKLSSLCDYKTGVNHVALWLALAIGIPGNILALLTILRFPRTTGTFYLTLLAIFDWLTLVTKVINIVMITYQVFDLVSCKLIIMLTNFTGNYANWILVLICFERFIAVLFPLQKNYYFTMRRARLGAIIVAVVIFLFCSVYLWNTTAGENICVTTDKDFQIIWVNVMSVIYSYLPAVLLIIMVLLIWKELKKIQKVREYIFCGDEGASSAALNQHIIQEQAKTERSITMMLLFAAVTFVLMTVPICVVLAVDSSGVANKSLFSLLYLEFSHSIARGLVLLTHAINFFIYFVSTKSFRNHAQELFRCLPSDRRHSYNEKTVNTVEEQM